MVRNLDASVKASNQVGSQQMTDRQVSACHAEAFGVGGLHVLCMSRTSTSALAALLFCILPILAREPQKSPPERPTIENRVVRTRDLGVPSNGTPGTFNARTAVGRMEVGYTTLISSDSKLIVGQGPVR